MSTFLHCINHKKIDLTTEKEKRKAKSRKRKGAAPLEWKR
jgi:hypothetical protein